MNLNATFHLLGQCTLSQTWRIIRRENVNIFNYVISGEAEYVYKGEIYKMLPGHIYIFPHSLDYTRQLTGDASLEHIFFDFISPAFSNTDNIIDIDTSAYKDIEYTIKGLSEFLKPYLDVNGNLWYWPVKNDNPYLLDTAAMYFQTIMNLIDRIYPVSIVLDKRISTALNYIHAHYSDNITIQSLADFVYLEKNYFVKLFKKCIKMPPHTYLRQYRLDMAVSMLKSGMAVNDIYERCGYQSAAAFSSAIKKELGVSPSQII